MEVLEMHRILPALVLILCVLFAVSLSGQPGRNETEAAREFLKSHPTIGDPFPDMSVYDADGQPFELAALRGSHTVLIFGCLT
jgi:cytochrome oxidase Cu insertion factor (SCO1/SenC/PrrC family)